MKFLKTALSLGLLTVSMVSYADFKTVDFKYQVPKNVQDLCKKRIQELGQANEDYLKDGCMVVDLETANSPYPVLNKAINDNVLYSSIADFDEEAEGIYQSLQDKENTQLFLFERSNDIERISQSARLLQVGMEDYVYHGGPHGMPTKEFYVYDIQKQKVLKIDDILVSPNKKSELEKLVNQAYLTYLKTGDNNKDFAMNDEEITQHLETWKFYLTDNFYFTPKGLTFTYQPYGLGAYAMGFINLNVDKDSLKTLIKSEYLNDKLTHFDDDNWSDD